MDNTTVELAALIARAWLDEEFKEQLKEEKGDHEVFNESGVMYDESILSKIEMVPCHIKVKSFISNCSSNSGLTCTNSRLTLRKYQGGDKDNYDISIENASVTETCKNQDGKIIITPKLGNRLIVEFNDWDKFKNDVKK